MKTTEFWGLKKGMIIEHKHYGDCNVIKKIKDFGFVIRPLSEEGKILLAAHSGTTIGDVLETSNRLIIGIRNENNHKKIN